MDMHHVLVDVVWINCCTFLTNTYGRNNHKCQIPCSVLSTISLFFKKATKWPQLLRGKHLVLCTHLNILKDNLKKAGVPDEGSTTQSYHFAVYENESYLNFSAHFHSIFCLEINHYMHFGSATTGRWRSFIWAHMIEMYPTPRTT